MSENRPSSIQELEARIEELGREYDELRSRMETEGAHLEPGQVDDGDFDPLEALEFERRMELAVLRAQLEDLRNPDPALYHYELSEISEPAPGNQCDVDDCGRPATMQVEWDAVDHRRVDVFCEDHGRQALDAHVQHLEMEAER